MIFNLPCLIAGGYLGLPLQASFWGGFIGFTLPRRYPAPMATPRMELGLALMAEWRELIVSLTARLGGTHPAVHGKHQNYN